MVYRKPILNMLAEYYLVVVLHSGQPTVGETDRYREIITPQKLLWRFHLQPRSPLGKIVHDFDVVIAMFDLGWPAYIAPLLWRKRPKYVLWGHRYSANSLACIARDYFLKRADRILLYGDEEVDMMKSRGVDASKISVAWNTLHIPNHKDTSCNEKSSFLFVGRLQKRKRIDLILNCFASILPKISDSTTLDIVGSGEIESELKDLARTLRIANRVNFYGRIDDPITLAKRFSLAHAYVSPGPVGLGVLHSLAYGVPVITLREARHGPEFHNLKDNHNSLICADQAELESAMHNICNDTELAKLLGKNAYTHYKTKRSPTRMVHGFIAAIEE